jgi:hypothetical protein
VTTYDVSVVRDRLSDRLGAPVQSFELPGAPYEGSAISRLSVLRFRSRSPEGTMLVSCGASALEMVDGRRAECFVLLRPDAKIETIAAIGRVMSMFVTFPERERVAVPPGSIVETGAELHGVSRMDALLVMPGDGFVDRLEVVRLLPIYGSEAEYAVRFGAHRLVERLEEEGFDLRDLARPSANTAKDPKDRPAGRRRFKVN